MKRLFTIFATLLATLSLSANNVVTLAVSGQGATKEEATANALRSAIEQAYGVFVSANTTILNDELVRDEIATVASGNIEKFEEISYVTTSNGEAFVTLSATVAISKLQAYAKSKGSSAEFAGATFAMNMKMRELNKQNEQKALLNMYYQLQELAPNVFDWELTAGYPTIQKDKNYKVPMTLTAKPNDASEAFYNILTNTLKSLSLTPTEIEEYKQVGLETFTMQTPQKVVVLRNNPKEIKAYLGYLVDKITLSYKIKQLTASGQTFYANTVARHNGEDITYLSDFARLYDRTNFYAYSKSSPSNIIVSADVFVSQEEMMYLQGFEVEHTPVNRITFKHDDGVLWASNVVIYQDIKHREFYDLCELWRKLDNLTISDSVTSIGSAAFDGCKWLKSITIPDSVTSIGRFAFSGCSSLTSITIPDSVTEIGGWAFRDCTSLTSITIPDSVTSIGEYTFYNCTSLTSVHITDIAAWCGIIFGNCYANPLYYAHNLYLNGELVTDLVIPDSVTSIGEYAFFGCTSLTSITIPDSVTSIGSAAFDGCTSLTSITISDSVTSIGEYAFFGCTSLTSITIPDSVTSIGDRAFSGCDLLTSITIPDSVTSIGEWVFYKCTSLTSVCCKAVTPPRGGLKMFAYNASGRKIYVPRASVNAYKAAKYWSEYAGYIEGYDF